MINSLFETISEYDFVRAEAKMRVGSADSTWSRNFDGPTRGGAPTETGYSAKTLIRECMLSYYVRYRL
jgi:hypothetical protein